MTYVLPLQNEAMAEAALESILLGAALGLAPAPPRVAPVTPATGMVIVSDKDGNSVLRSGRAKAPPEIKEVKVVRRRPKQQWILGDGVAMTAQYTWDLARRCASRTQLLRALARIKGYYRNLYRNGWHRDSDAHMETYILLWALAEMERAAELGVPTPAGTLVPELGVEIHPDPNEMVVTVLLKHLLHATGAPKATRELTSCDRRELGRSAKESFLLQSRGRGTGFMIPEEDYED